jgi:feruloyl esterase
MRWRLATAAIGALWMLVANPANAATGCADLRNLTIPLITISSATEIAAGMFTPPGARIHALDVPAFCRVAAIARPTSDSEIRFELWLPLRDQWNGKFEGVGTGGYLGAISYAAMGPALQRGYAVASTDMGHQGGDLVFGQGHPQKVIDWAYRAIHVTAVSAKLIVRDFYGAHPRWSYFVGCATGGHQAMSEVERYPDDYDGVIAGDPAADRVHETAAYLWAWEATHDANGRSLLSHSDLQFITRSVVANCDAVDGIADGVVDDPRRCRFDVATLRCRPGQATGCLSPEQVAAVEKVYGGLHRADTGKLIFPGWPVGSEGYGDGPNDGWGAFITDPPVPMRSDLYNYFVFHDPSWNFRTFDFAKDLDYADAAVPYISAVDFDLRPFRARGGKLIMYSGWSDPVLPAEDVIWHYDDILRDTTGGGANDFVRLFMVPGMGHCSGGPGPTSFDMVTALERWVEHNHAPSAVAAWRSRADGTKRGRLLCAYPAAARWSGHGSADLSNNFRCTRRNDTTN